MDKGEFFDVLGLLAGLALGLSVLTAEGCGFYWKPTFAIQCPPVPAQDSRKAQLDRYLDTSLWWGNPAVQPGSSAVEAQGCGLTQAEHGVVAR